MNIAQFIYIIDKHNFVYISDHFRVHKYGETAH